MGTGDRGPRGGNSHSVSLSRSHSKKNSRARRRKRMRVRIGGVRVARHATSCPAPLSFWRGAGGEARGASARCEGLGTKYGLGWASLECHLCQSRRHPLWNNSNRPNAPPFAVLRPSYLVPTFMPISGIIYRFFMSLDLRSFAAWKIQSPRESKAESSRLGVCRSCWTVIWQNFIR